MRHPIKDHYYKMITYGIEHIVQFKDIKFSPNLVSIDLYHLNSKKNRDLSLYF
jgi:hypothetical protein